MKKYIVLPLFFAMGIGAFAQDFDSNPTITIANNKEDMHFTIGARFMSDVALYNYKYTSLKSGADLTDARIRTSLTYQNWYFYADFGFGGGKFAQKNIFLQYNFNENHSLRAGYFNDVASMARNTSLGSYHFISRPSASMALYDGRQLGVAYKFYNNKFFANQGVYAERKYNNQEAGSQGFTLSGRWLYKPVNTQDNTVAIGAQARYALINAGKMYDANVKTTSISFETPFETYVDQTALVGAELPWARESVNIGAEFLYKNSKFFTRGEYTHRLITKERNSKSLFFSSLGTIDSFNNLSSWENYYPLATTHFNAAYIECGYKIFGDDYNYNNAEAVLSGMNSKGLEVVARYSFTGLNDIKKGEYYLLGRDQFYPNGYPTDWPNASTSVGGGNLHSVTIGANYAFNKFAQVMLDYSIHFLAKNRYPLDKQFQCLQARLQFAF